MGFNALTRRGVIVGAGAGALLAGRARAAPPPGINVGFFTETKPSMIAKGKDWFAEDAGAKINWTEMGSGADINAGIAAGSLDMGLGAGSVPVAAGISQGLGYKVVAIMDNIGPGEDMVVRTSDGIKSPADFKGKKVATPFGSTSHFRLLGFLKTNGLTQRDVTVLDMKPAAIQAAWSRGDIDAAYVWPPARSKIIEDGGTLYPTWDKLDKAGYVIADLIIVRIGFANEYPQAVVGFLKAYGRALALWEQKPEEAASVVAQQAGVAPAVALADMKQYDFVPFREQESSRWLGKPGDPGQFARVLHDTAEFLVEQRSIRKAPGLAAFQQAIDTEYLQKAIG